MNKGVITAAVLLLLQAFGATAADGDAAYRQALLKELNNRKLAGVVVSALAEAHRGTPQGEFWLAYSQLEAEQWPLYEAQAELHELSPGGVFLSLKAQASILFARLLPETFIGMLSQATQAYAAELAALDPPATQRAFWDYVIAQERAQAEAFQHAAQQDYPAARSVLVGFMENASSASLDR
ncbi:hypothetical protein SAMN05216603_11046 [Pseudomonas benzenivorans]|nr:hypothetical protein [Pseudomonas benzenivorans]SDH54023.1 hypothetical protein SAMN05216603_11046 [Pseudomonas benzenivorans]